MKRLLLILWMVPGILTLAAAQTKSPDEFLGYPLGSRFSSHEQVTDYFRYIASKEKNVRLVSYGRSYEGRELMVAIVSSPENMVNLERIRVSNLALSKAEKPGVGPGEQPAVLWLSYQLRLAGSFEPTGPQWILILLAPVVALPIFLRLGLYRAVIRYLPERAVFTVLWAMTLATMGWVFVLFVAEVTRMAVLPRTVPIFYFLLGTIVIAGSRFLAKVVLYPNQTGGEGPQGVLVYGAGEAGRQLCRR